MRRSMPLAPTLSEMRPSWGTRCSAMFMSAMTLRRVVTAAAMVFGPVDTSWSTPSIRYRMRRSLSVGSMWMSDARSFSAWRMSRFTYRTIGAVSVTVWMSSTPFSWPPPSMPSDASMAMSAASPLLKARLM